MKKNLLLSFVSLVLVLAMATYSAYAWFMFGSTEFRNVIFTAGNMNVTSHFWLIQDHNRDGYYDYQEDGNVMLIDTQNTLLGTDNNIITERAAEGDIFSYRFLVQSTSDIPVALTIRLDNLTSPIHNIITWNYAGYTRYRSLLYSDVNLITDFSNLEDPAAFNKIVVSQPETKQYRTTQVVGVGQEIIMYPQDIFVFDLKIRYEYLEWLQAWNPTTFTPEADLSAYSDATFNSTTLYIEFVSF